MSSPTQSFTLTLIVFFGKIFIDGSYRGWKKLNHSLIYMIIIILNLKKQNPNFIQVEFQPKFQRNEKFQRNFAKLTKFDFNYNCEVVSIATIFFFSCCLFCLFPFPFFSLSLHQRKIKEGDMRLKGRRNPTLN